MANNSLLAYWLFSKQEPSICVGSDNLFIKQTPRKRFLEIMIRSKASLGLFVINMLQAAENDVLSLPHAAFVACYFNLYPELKFSSHSLRGCLMFDLVRSIGCV